MAKKTREINKGTLLGKEWKKLKRKKREKKKNSPHNSVVRIRRTEPFRQQQRRVSLVLDLGRCVSAEGRLFDGEVPVRDSELGVD